MRAPIENEHFLKTISKKIVIFANNWFVKNVLKPIVLIFPPVFATLLTRGSMQEQITKFTSEEIATFLNDSALLIILFTYLYVVIVKGVYAGIKSYSKPEKELRVDDLVALVGAIDLVVGDKTRRMNAEAQRQTQKPEVCAKDVFNVITKPDQQIVLLTTGLRTIFEYIDNTKASFRVGLMRIKDDKPVKWAAFEPVAKGPRTSPEVLSAPSSTISHAINNRSIVVVNDIQKEMKKRTKAERRFLKGNVQVGEQGSQLCYPIINSNNGEIDYVITITGNRQDCLVDKHKEIYSWIIEHFSVRISMEHSLLLMKEKAA